MHLADYFMQSDLLWLYILYQFVCSHFPGINRAKFIDNEYKVFIQFVLFTVLLSAVYLIDTKNVISLIVFNLR